MSAPDLSAATTQELIDALRGRCDVFFCCFRPKVRKDYAWQWSYSGGLDGVFRLIEESKFDILNEQMFDDGDEPLPSSPFDS